MNQKITLSDLADLLAAKSHISKASANSFIRDIFDTILAALNEGESVKVRQLGTFKIADVSARMGVDVNTGQAIEIAGRQRITFTPDKELAEAVNAPFAGFETVVISDVATADTEAEEPSEAADEEPAAIIPPELPELPATPEPPALPEDPVDSGEEESAEEPIPHIAALADLGASGAESANEEPATEPQAVSFADENDDIPSAASHGKGRFWLGFIIGAVVGALIASAIYFLPKCGACDNGKETPAAVATDSIAPDKAATSVSEPQPDKPLATDTVTATRYLTKMAREYYGDTNFWVYIYEENKDKIDNPDLIKPGTAVTIPQPAKYGIDAFNPESVAKAKRLSYDILSKY